MLLVSGLACGLCANTEAQAFALALAGGWAGFGVAPAGEAITIAPIAAVTAARTVTLQHVRLIVMRTDSTVPSGGVHRTAKRSAVGLRAKRLDLARHAVSRAAATAWSRPWSLAGPSRSTVR